MRMNSHLQPFFSTWGYPVRRTCINPQNPTKPASIIKAHSDSVGMGPMAAGAAATSSKAPMSQRGPCGRAVPRWSTVAQISMPARLGLPVSMAGLPVFKAMVWVGPPLLAKAASRGLVLVRLPVPPAKLQLASLTRLKLDRLSNAIPPQLSGVLLATMLLNACELSMLSTIPPPDTVAELPLMVTLRRVIRPPSPRIAPPTVALLPVK